MDYTGIGRRIREARESRGLTQRELGKQLGYSQTAINGWETARRRISLDDLERLSRALHRPLAWFLGAEVSGLPLEGYLAKALEKPLSEFLPLKAIPILRSAGAGGAQLLQENVEDELTVPRNLAADFAVRVSTDSMVGAGLFVGDLAVCRRTGEAAGGEMVVVVTKEGEMLIRYLVGEGTGRKLRAAAPGYPDLPCEEGEIRVEGVVEQVIHRPPPEEKAAMVAMPANLYLLNHKNVDLAKIIREGSVSYQGKSLNQSEKDKVLKAIDRAIKESPGKQDEEDLDPDLVRKVARILRELQNGAD